MKRPTTYLIIIRKRIYYIAILIILIGSIVLLPNKAIINAMKINSIRPLNNKTLIIDPGHGGIDGGTNFADILEKDINLIISLKLKELLIKKGATVLMTREIDDSLDDHIPNNGSRHREDLNSRVKIVNNSKADILLSIHVNHIKNVNKIGPIVFYNTSSEESKYFANHIQEYLNNLSSYKEMDIATKHKATPGDYYLLQNSSPPGVIIEIGFISNKSDRRLLLDNKHLDEIVELITKGIIDYFYEDR